MSKRVFRVEAQIKWRSERDWFDWDATRVLAVDAERAIVAARKYLLGTKSPGDKESKDDEIIGFRLLGVTSITEVDIVG